MENMSVKQVKFGTNMTEGGEGKKGRGGIVVTLRQ